MGITFGGGDPAAISVGGAEAAPEVEGYTPGVLNTVNISTVGSAPILDTETYVNATFQLIDRKGVSQSGTLRIRGRGNYTWTLPKKPYRLNFPADRTVFGMAASQRDWALLANHDDPRKIANIVGFTLAAQMHGLDWTPEFRLVEVNLNGVYQGLYLLTDLVRLEPGRVEGESVDGITGDSLTGTWLAEISQRYITEGVPGFTTTRSVMVQYDDPEVDPASLDAEEAAQAVYFRDWIQAFENTLYGVTFTDPATGYRPLVDLQSFADWYLVNELGSNQDSQFGSSVKLWKERDSLGGKLHIGPIWDMGIAFGNVVNEAHPTTGWYVIPGAKWIARMLEDPTFQTLVETRWAYLLTLLPSIYNTIDRSMGLQAAAIARDTTRWGASAVDTAAAATFVKDWIAARAAWITANL